MRRVLHILLVLLIALQPVASAVAGVDRAMEAGAAEAHCPHCDEGCPGCDDRGEGCGAAGCFGAGCSAGGVSQLGVPVQPLLLERVSEQRLLPAAIADPPAGRSDAPLRPPRQS